MAYGLAAIEYETEQGNTLQSRVEQAVAKAFLTAYLLTANGEQAQRAVTEALGSWVLEDDGEEELFRQALAVAARKSAPPKLSRFNEPFAVRLPVPLRAVLDLPMQARRCYVLRILAGLSREVSAQWLDLRCGQVDEFTCAALAALPSLAAGLNLGFDLN